MQTPPPPLALGGDTRVKRLPWRPVPVALGIALLFALRHGNDVDDRAPNRSAAVAGVLSSRGFSCDEGDVTWVAGPSGVRGAMTGGAKALVRASVKGEPSDLYLVEATLSPEGALLEVDGTWNVTRTTGVDESRPLVRAGSGAGVWVAYTTSVDGIATGIHALDVSGRSPAVYTEFNRTQRWQMMLTSLQQTGQTGGVMHNAFALDPPANQVDLVWRDDGMVGAKADGRAIVLDPVKGVAVDGAGWVRAAPEVKARPGSVVTWAVDRVRALPWFGEEKMQVVKAVAFTGLDWVLRFQAEVFGDSSAKEVSDDLGGVNSGSTNRVSFTDPEIGWPPAPMKPLLSPPLPGEGQWIALDHDPFITQAAGAPAAFVTSFIRSDKQRPQTRIYVTLWDPRQIALHMAAGTVEPVSASGEAGPGVIPRAPEILRRVVGGFNGGFQAIHGEFGMQADGVLYLPPKPYAATVAELRDGSTVFGAWPNSQEVPDEVLSYRQNLTALVQNDKFNPWGRTWWGGTPKGWSDNIHTTRSAICLTKENYVGYFWGHDLSADVLAEGMLLARCSFGVHLDMNPGLAGFEFYNVQPTSTWADLGRPIQQDWEWEGTFRELPDFHVRARRMIKGMMHMNFPQYIHRDGRDFFYLTQRPVLPGAELPARITPKQPGEGAWRLKGLPQHGFPYALTTTWLRPDPKRPDLKVRVLRIDPRAVTPAASSGTTSETPTIASFAGPLRTKVDAGHAPDSSGLGLWFASGVFLVGGAAPSTDAFALAAGTSPRSPHAVGARGMAGVQDEDGMLDWIELAPDSPSDAGAIAAMDSLLATLGCGARVALAPEARAFIGGNLDLAGEATVAPSGPVARLVRGNPPGAHPYFTSTPIVGPGVWQPLQNQRIRYFRRAAPKDAGAPAPSPPSTPSSAAPEAPTPAPSPTPP